MTNVSWRKLAMVVLYKFLLYIVADEGHCIQTHRGPVTQYGNIDLGQHGLR